MGRLPKTTEIAVRWTLWTFCWMLTSPGLQAESLPRFELANWDGRKVSTDSLKGRTTILVFTYAKCAFACPMVTYQLKELDEEMGSPPDLRFLHISVNPAQDTPEEVLRHFEKHDIDPRRDLRWLFLIGPESSVASALKAFGIEVKRTPVERDVLIEHTMKALVIDPEGRPVMAFNTYQWDKEEMLRALRASTKKG